ncbi:helix-turn-helix domain-containing protein [Halegenticoccus soli]|uniref:helix-turn-helix domain-containing protein n=1 Tax=Halegenticoccus soli TaxID=1985678 RepID=UPI000C6E8C52|nr:helix-turn-helix domain-containing protein [Halegenticoccus soli]
MRARYATVRIDSGSGGFHPAECALADEPGVTREGIRRVNRLDDGTIAASYELRGDLDRARELLASSPSVLACDVVGERTGVAYVHSVPTDPVASLLSILRRNEIVLDAPLEYTATGDLRVTLLGGSRALRRAIDEAAKSVGVELERTGDYARNARNPEAALTDRQRQLLTVAVDMGYYEIPRRTTLAEIAAAVGIGRATAGEHLRKAEAKAVARTVR